MKLENDYSRLPGALYTRLDPVPVIAPRLIKFNGPLATELRLELDLSDPDHLAQIFSGNEKLPGSQPIALAYAGHQFGSFVPHLGDGRAVLLGEARDHRGVLRDIQLKGGRAYGLLSGRGRQSSIGSGSKGIPGERGHDGVGNSLHAGTSRRLDRGKGEARTCVVAGGNPDACG